MLIKCSECALQISDKALYCPHCGYPLQPDIIREKIKAPKKRKRLPNGFGQISEIKNQKLRNRFRAMVTIGRTKEGKTICKPLKPESFFPTYNDAYSALVEYNKNPYDLSPSMTINELYEKWSDEYFKTLKSDSSIRTITAAWAYCSSIGNMRVKDVRARHIKGCIEDGTTIIKGEEHHPTAGIKQRIKSLFNIMLDYAVEYEMVDRNYSRTFNLSDDIIRESEETRRGHIPFSDDEMKKMWDNVNTINYVDVVLIQCYSGWRPQELGLIELDNVDIENWIFVGGMKTSAGTNRSVPIHSRIRELVKARYEEARSLNSKYLINCSDGTTHKSSIMFTYDKYQQRFKKIRDMLNLNDMHRAHDGRMHFITSAKKYGVDEYAIKYIVGHEINDVTEKVYTKREIGWLQTEIEKIK